jgi:hypothetical protein
VANRSPRDREKQLETMAKTIEVNRKLEKELQERFDRALAKLRRLAAA